MKNKAMETLSGTDIHQLLGYISLLTVFVGLITLIWSTACGFSLCIGGFISYFATIDFFSYES